MMIFILKVTNMNHMPKEIIIIIAIKMISHHRNFMVELINYLLNYVMIIVVNVMN